MKLRAVITIIFICLLVPLASSCEPGLYLQVENQTEYTVTIRVDGRPYFDVLPHTTATKVTITTNYPPYFVEGVSENGEIVYSRYFTRNDFIGSTMKGSTVEIFILANESNPYLPLEIENLLNNEIILRVDGATICSVDAGATLRRRPLPSDLSTYAITVTESYIGEEGYRVYQSILDQTYSRDELEKQNWRITISNP